ncbi:hypothetical protein V2J09_017327 [Rumex salicifolius]
MGSQMEPAASVLDSNLRGLPDNVVQEMLQALGIAMFCVNWAPQERPSMKEVVALLMEVKTPHPQEDHHHHHHGKKTSSQPLINQRQGSTA